jgi:hypothetical protein
MAAKAGMINGIKLLKKFGGAVNAIRADCVFGQLLGAKMMGDFSLARCAVVAPGVEMSLDAARMSACATLA